MYKDEQAEVRSAIGWLRLVGSLKISVSFAEYSLFYRALLQKRPVFLGSLLVVATPYCLPTHLLTFEAHSDDLLLIYSPSKLTQMICSSTIAAYAQRYRVAMISRLPKNIGLICRISSLLQGSFAKETHVFREPTHRSHLTAELATTC